MNENLRNNIVCFHCGTTNSLDTKFCIKCGTSLQSQQISENQNMVLGNNVINQSLNDESNINDTNQNSAQQSESQQSYTNISINNYNTSSKDGSESLNYVSYIIGALLKPFDQFKNEEKNLQNVKNVSVLSSIVVGVLTIIRLITKMISAVRVKSFLSNEVRWVWENLKEVQYFKILGQSILIYAGILVVISGVYYLANLVIKKDAKFVNILAATTTAFIPFAVCSSILAPLLSMIYAPLKICITVIGIVYALVSLLELINELINVENKNSRIYFHMICLSIIFIGGGLIAYKVILGSLTSGLGLLGNLFS